MEEKEKNYEIKIVNAEGQIDQLVKLGELAEKKALAIKKIKNQALRLTNENDWVDIDGHPYLQSSGAEKIRSMFGISWEFVNEPVMRNEEGGHYRYEVTMKFHFADSSIEVIGTRSSKDHFFTTRYIEGKKVIMPVSEVDKNDVLKSAISNCIVNGITRILGIRNLTYEDLKEGGIDVSKIIKVKFKKEKEEEKKEEKTEEKTEEKRVKKEWKDFDFLKSMNQAKKALKELTGEDELYYKVLKKFGYEHADQVRPEDKEKVYQEMKEVYKKTISTL